MAFVEMTDGGEVFKFNKIGDSVTGVYLSTESRDSGPFGPAVIFSLKTDSGLRAVFSKPDGHIAQLFKRANPGSLVRLTFDRTKPTKKGNPMKLYKLEIDDTFVADPADLEAAATATDDAEEYVEEVVNTPPAKRNPTGSGVNSSKQAEIAARLNARKTG